MSELTIYKLRFTSPLHISNSRSDYGISLRTIDSDTMYAALTTCLAKLGKNIPENGDLGFTISSLFPYYQKTKEDKPLYFFPKPINAKIPDTAENRKQIKKIKYLDAGYFSQILSGKIAIKDKDIKGDYLCSGEIDKDFIYSKVAQRVRIKDRTLHEEAEPYFVDKVFFKDYSGMFFIVQGDTTLLDKALPLLATEGIGTDRNVGNGFFEYTTDTISINIPKKANYFLNLSMFFPESKEQLKSLIINKENNENNEDENIAYDIQRRGGWITSYPFQSLRKNVIYGFSAGSVFKKETSGLETLGKIVDLRPKWNDNNMHHIFRCGRALILPINI